MHLNFIRSASIRLYTLLPQLRNRTGILSDERPIITDRAFVVHEIVDGFDRVRSTLWTGFLVSIKVEVYLCFTVGTEAVGSAARVRQFSAKIVTVPPKVK
jgi:hypothetical protein